MPGKRGIYGQLHWQIRQTNEMIHENFLFRYAINLSSTLFPVDFASKLDPALTPLESRAKIGRFA